MRGAIPSVGRASTSRGSAVETAAGLFANHLGTGTLLPVLGAKHRVQHPTHSSSSARPHRACCVLRRRLITKPRSSHHHHHRSPAMPRGEAPTLTLHSVVVGRSGTARAVAHRLISCGVRGGPRAAPPRPQQASKPTSSSGPHASGEPGVGPYRPKPAAPGGRAHHFLHRSNGPARPLGDGPRRAAGAPGTAPDASGPDPQTACKAEGGAMPETRGTHARAPGRRDGGEQQRQQQRQ